MNTEHRKWIEPQLERLNFVEWDRFTEGEWDDEIAVNVYGWIEREDDHEDFVLIIFWPEGREYYYVTSSEEYTEEIGSRLDQDADDDGTHNECKRVERTFDIQNAVTLHEEPTLDAFTGDGDD